MPRAWPSRPTWFAAAAAVCLLIGLWLWLRQPDQAGAYGWFSYAPLSQDAFVPTRPSAGRDWGIGLTGLGVALISGVFGYWLGRLQSSSDTPEGGRLEGGTAGPSPRQSHSDLGT